MNHEDFFSDSNFIYDSISVVVKTYNVMILYYKMIRIDEKAWTSKNFCLSLFLQNLS